jgi:death-on-curing protein
MTILIVDQIINLHKMMLRSTGGAEGIRDIGALESSVYHAFATFDGKDLYPSLEEKAARQAYGIINSHPFTDGNKRIGLLVMLVFLEINDIKLRYSQEELIDLGMSAASGKKDYQAIYKWIIDHRL